MYDPNIMLIENSKKNSSKQKRSSSHCRKINNLPIKDSSNYISKLNENVIRTIENNSRYHDIISYRKLLFNSKKNDNLNNLHNHSTNKNLINSAGVKNLNSVNFFKKRSKNKNRSKSNTKELRYSKKNENKLNINETISAIGVAKMYIKNIKKINREEDYMIKSQFNTNINNINNIKNKIIENKKHFKFNSMRSANTNKNNLKEIQNKEKGIALPKKINISRYNEDINSNIIIIQP